MQEKRPLQSIPDHELLQRLAALVGQSRRVEVDIVAHIAEVEERGLHAREGFPSMFAYCREALHLSEQEGYLRIAVARASREHPMLLAMLADGRLHLTAIAKLARHLTRENRDGLLARAVHKTKRQIEELIAEIAPRPDVPAKVRKLPERASGPASLFVAPGGGSGPRVARGPGPNPILEPTPDSTLRLGPDRVAAPEPGTPGDEAASRRDGLNLYGSVAAASAAPTSRPVAISRESPSVVQPLSPGRYKVQFTASAEFHRKLERLQALTDSKASAGDLAAVIEQAVTEKLERLEARRFGRTRAPRKSTAETNLRQRSGTVRTDTEQGRDSAPSSRHIPAAVRRAVYERDSGRCRYVNEQGRRCEERDRLEFHHRHPFGFGGEHSVKNVRLMCQAHNAFLAECDYGRAAMASHRRPRSRAAPAPGD
jgi:5-methylcytosine-specific restriction endonuclease McrA